MPANDRINYGCLSELIFEKPLFSSSIRLSDKNPDWNNLPNGFGDLPEIDFAYCAPFKCLSDESIIAVKQVIESNKQWAYSNERAITLRGNTQLQKWFESEELERIVSEIAGVDLIVSPLEIEHAHVNLQAEIGDAIEQDRRAVDDWHYDYVPFVFITMISKSKASIGGRLCTDFGDFCLEQGESILVQGSHVKHMAEKVNDGNRITLIVSFSPKSLTYKDTTRIVPWKLPYAPDEPIAKQAIAFRFNHLSRQCGRLISCDPFRDGEKIEEIIKGIKDDIHRWEEMQSESIANNVIVESDLPHLFDGDEPMSIN